MFLAALGADDAFALRRVALIIGNAQYEHAGVLANTLNDAHAIAALLKRAKFDIVDERDNLGVVEMKRAVRDFTAIAGNADIAVIYYSGHGIEAVGRQLPHPRRRQARQRLRRRGRDAAARPASVGDRPGSNR